MARYRVDEGEKRALRKVLEEDHLYSFSKEEHSLFAVDAGFLCYGEYRVRRVPDNTFVHGDRLFTVDTEIAVHVLPSECAPEHRNDVLEYRGVDGCSDVILQIQDISVRRHAAALHPVRVHHREVGGRLLMMVVERNAVHMEYDGFAASKPCSADVYGVDMERWELLTLCSRADAFDLYMSLQIFTDLPVDLSMQGKVEAFLFRLFVFSDQGRVLAEKLEHGGRDERMEGILCRLYRKVDDCGKRDLDALVRNIRSIDALRLVVIYFPCEVERYIDLCIQENREYELEELVEHYRGSEMLESVSRMLLERNCFHLFCLCRPEYRVQLEDVVLVEKYNTRSQRNLRTRRSSGC